MSTNDQTKSISESAQYALVHGLLRQWLKLRKPLVMRQSTFN